MATKSAAAKKVVGKSAGKKAPAKKSPAKKSPAKKTSKPPFPPSNLTEEGREKIRQAQYRRWKKVKAALKSAKSTGKKKAVGTRKSAKAA